MGCCVSEAWLGGEGASIPANDANSMLFYPQLRMNGTRISWASSDSIQQRHSDVRCRRCGVLDDLRCREGGGEVVNSSIRRRVSGKSRMTRNRHAARDRSINRVKYDRHRSFPALSGQKCRSAQSIDYCCKKSITLHPIYHAVDVRDGKSVEFEPSSCAILVFFRPCWGDLKAE